MGLDLTLQVIVALWLTNADLFYGLNPPSLAKLFHGSQSCPVISIFCSVFGMDCVC